MIFKPYILLTIFVYLIAIFSVLFILLGDLLTIYFSNLLKKKSTPLASSSFDHPFVKDFLDKKCEDVIQIYVPDDSINKPNEIKKFIKWGNFWTLVAYDLDYFKDLVKELRVSCFFLLIGAFVALLISAGEGGVDLLDLNTFSNNSAIQLLGFTDFVVLLVSINRFKAEKRKIEKLLAS